MVRVTKFLQMILSWALFGAIIMTLIAPTVSRLLISAPVSFGTNCEPAANWSMQTLIKSQSIGLILGIVFGLALTAYLRSKENKKIKSATPE